MTAQKGTDGSVAQLEITDLGGEVSTHLEVFEGASSGMLGDEDALGGGRRTGARRSRRADLLRELLGGAVRHLGDAQRRQRAGVRADPRPGSDQNLLRSRPRTSPSENEREETRCHFFGALPEPQRSAGTATHVSNNVSRRQANKWAGQEQQQYEQQQQQAPPPPAAAPVDDSMDKLKELGQLHESRPHRRGVRRRAVNTRSWASVASACSWA